MAKPSNKLQIPAEVWLYDFSIIHSPTQSRFDPVNSKHEYYSQKKLMILKIQGVEYEQVYFDEKGKYIFVRLLEKEKIERASTMKADSVAISKATVPKPTNNPPPLDIKFDKLLPNAYAFLPNYKTLNTQITTLLQHRNDQNVISNLQREWNEVQRVELTKELERTEIFFQELQQKVDKDIEVIHEYGTLGKDSNYYTQCGTSRIDIVLLNRKARQQKGDTYRAGAVMEMKTCSKHTLKPENEAQTAYEMMKLGADKFIQDVLRQGNVTVNKVVVDGILVDMELAAGLVMQLEMDFKTGRAKCIRDSFGTIPLRNAFQQIREQVLIV